MDMQGLENEEDNLWRSFMDCEANRQQEILTSREVPQGPLYPQSNANCLMNDTLASLHHMQPQPGEDPNCLPCQGVPRDTTRMDKVHDAATAHYFLQEGGVCPSSLRHSVHQEDTLMVEFDDDEGLETQRHINPPLEPSDTLTSTPDQAKHGKKRKIFNQRPIGRKFPSAKLFEGQTFNDNMDEICRSLEDVSVGRVGIYGMGGSGKTTIMKLIHNLLLEGYFRPCSHVIWVTISQDYTISKLQHHLASLFEIKLPHDENEVAWATSLHEEMQKMHFVLILDDVWNEVNLEQVGIPEPTQDNGCKLILTTRLLDVCKKMQCKPILLSLLSENEAWELFAKTLNVHPEKSTLRGTMKEVAKECACLPLAIVTVAGSMRGIDDGHEWSYALESLRDHTYGFTDMKDKVLEQLKFSYDRLSEQLQKCLLSCALYPEDSPIDKEELIMMLIMEGTIGSNKSLKSAYDHGYTILNKLENACLLTCGSDNKFEIHDLIRDMCLIITEGCFLVKCNSKFPPNGSEYTEVLEKVSLMNSRIEEMCLDVAPNCPKLSTLLLSNNYRLSEIPDSFFMGFPKLKVLNLSKTSIQVLPSSVTGLVSLNALVLHGCHKLRCLPCLTPLKVLKQLDLSDSGIVEVPEGLENLVNLTCLSLYHTFIEPDTSLVVTNLVKLQRLVLSDEIKIMMKGVKQFKYLDVFKAKFANWEDFTEYVSFMLNSGQGPSDYRIKGKFTRTGASCASMSYVISGKDKGEDGRIKAKLKLRDHNTRGENWLLHEVMGQIPLPKFVQGLYLYGLGYKSGSESGQGKTKENGEMKGLFDATFSCTFTNLVELEVEHFHFTKDLISFSSSPKVQHCFQNLLVLRISNCKNLENIVSSANPTEIEESNNSFNFPKLRKLYLEGLPNWRSILICPSIEYISICGCPKLNRLPVQLPMLDYDSRQVISPLPSLKIIEGHLKWWESLEWDQPHAKALLLPCFKRTNFFDMESSSSSSDSDSE